MASAINIFGLTIGLTCCFLIALYIRHETSYDRFEVNGNRIARVIMEYQFAGSSASTEGNFTSVRVAPVLKRNFPEVESAVKLVNYERVVRHDDRLFSEKRFMYADSTFLQMFSFPLLEGNAAEALAGPHKVLLTQSSAKKYFGSADPVGKLLHVGNDTVDYEITGILQDGPSASQLKFDFVASFSSLGIPKDAEDTYWDANYTTYLMLRDRPSIASLERKLVPFMNKEKHDGATIRMHLEPFDTIHLHSPYAASEPNNSMANIYILAAVALLILIIACSTYINLSTARSLERAREVGVRKVAGAAKAQLFWQFLGESLFMALLAAVLSLGISALLIGQFNQLTGKDLLAGDLFSPAFIGTAAALVIMVGVLAGSYPAIVLTGFQPSRVLKGAFKNTASGQLLRKSLIVFQFAISVFLVVGTLIIGRQLYFIQHKQLGYDREHVIVMPMDGRMMEKIDLIKQQFGSQPGVASVSRCFRSPVEGGGGYTMRSETMPQGEEINVTANPIDEDFIPTLGLQIIAGENLDHHDILDAANDISEKNIYHFILNESAAKQLGWSPGQAIGRKLFMGERKGTVRGVVRDFHFESLHNPIKPFILFPEARGRELLAKISGSNMQATIGALATKWKELVPHRPFEYRFMDEDYDKLYSSELRLGKSMNVFSVI
ncbi:MAG TPA: ABC transporter permease, partial [Chitinophagaceae bacterium]